MKAINGALACFILFTSPWAMAQNQPSSTGKIKKTSTQPSRVYEGNTPRATAAAAAASAVTPEQLAVADRVLVGSINCEFGQQVSLEKITDQPGHFRLSFKGNDYTVVPEPSNTGAVRLEDKRAGIVWLQIGTKSMMMNSKLGQRMVDECKHPVQMAAR